MRRAARRAERGGAERVLEMHALLAQAVDVRRLEMLGCRRSPMASQRWSSVRMNSTLGRLAWSAAAWAGIKAAKLPETALSHEDGFQQVHHFSLTVGGSGIWPAGFCHGAAPPRRR